MPTDEVKSYLEEIDEDVKMPEIPVRPVDVKSETNVAQEHGLETLGGFVHEQNEQHEHNENNNDKYDKILRELPENTQHDAVIPADAQTLSGHVDAESRVQKLVDLAQTKGVVHAVKVARHLHNNYELDMLQAHLSADDVRNALEVHGFLKNE